MREPTQSDSDEIAKLHDELPTSSRWRHIPEPQPLFVEQPKPALTPRRAAIIATVLLCAVLGTFLFLRTNRTPSPSPVERAMSSPAPTVATNSTPVFHEYPAPRHAEHSAVPETTSVIITPDDRKIDQVLRLYTSNPTQDHIGTAQALINLLPTLTKQGQMEGARHIANLLPDGEYERIMPVWRSARSDRDVIEILGSDLINRDPRIMLPAMLEALRQPAHPFHERSRQTLQLFLDADYGNDFAKWDEATKRFVTLQAATVRTGG